MNIPFILKSIRDELRESGVSSVCRMLASRAYLRYQEWRFGVYTEEVFLTTELGLQDSDFHDYGATDWWHLKKLLKQMDITYSRNAFVDFGAGMGRALVIAAMFPFKRVVGVEISPKLATIAEQNILRAKQKLVCSDVSIVNRDASKFVIEDDMSVFYFFNPFHGRTLEAVLNSIHASTTTTPRKAWVVCRLPPVSEFEKQVSTVDWLELTNEIKTESGVKYCIFSVTLGR